MTAARQQSATRRRRLMRTAEDLRQELSAVDESHHVEAKRAPQIGQPTVETPSA